MLPEAPNPNHSSDDSMDPGHRRVGRPGLIGRARQQLTLGVQSHAVLEEVALAKRTVSVG